MRISVTQSHIDNANAMHDDLVDPVSLAITEWIETIRPGWFALCQANTIALCSGVTATPDQGDLAVSATIELEIDMSIKVGNWLYAWYWEDREGPHAANVKPFEFDLPSTIIDQLNTPDNP